MTMIFVKSSFGIANVLKDGLDDLKDELGLSLILLSNCPI